MSRYTYMVSKVLFEATFKIHIIRVSVMIACICIIETSSWDIVRAACDQYNVVFYTLLLRQSAGNCFPNARWTEFLYCWTELVCTTKLQQLFFHFTASSQLMASPSLYTIYIYYTAWTRTVKSGPWYNITYIYIQYSIFNIIQMHHVQAH